jgi:hypothetical protein
MTQNAIRTAAARPARADVSFERRAVKAAVWGMPIVSVDAMRQAFVRDAGGKYNDIAFSTSRGRDSTRRTPIRRAVPWNSWRPSPRADVLSPPSRPRRCRPQRC